MIICVVERWLSSFPVRKVLAWPGMPVGHVMMMGRFTEAIELRLGSRRFSCPSKLKDKNVRVWVLLNLKGLFEASFC